MPPAVRARCTTAADAYTGYPTAGWLTGRNRDTERREKDDTKWNRSQRFIQGCRVCRISGVRWAVSMKAPQMERPERSETIILQLYFSRPRSAPWTPAGAPVQQPPLSRRPPLVVAARTGRAPRSNIRGAESRTLQRRHRARPARPCVAPGRFPAARSGCTTELPELPLVNRERHGCGIELL